MASFENVKTVNLEAGEDLRGGFGLLLTIENDTNVGKVIKASGATDVPVGILAEEPNANVSTDGYNVPVTLLSGKVIMTAGGAITAGNLLVVDTGDAGKVVGVAGVVNIPANGVAVGVALESAVDGDRFTALALQTSASQAV